MMSIIKKFLYTTIVILSLINIAWADEAVLTQRVDRLERIIKGQGLASLLGRVDQLQNEIQRLKGDNESLRHELEVMQKRQRDLYLDLDERLQKQATVLSNTTQNVSNAVSEVTVNTNEPVKETATPSVKTDAVPVSVESGEAAYQSALQTLRSGQYEQAIKALSEFPKRYPQSSYVPNAYYWQGEANYVLRNFKSAITAFKIVIKDYPASTKVADATLKLGFSQYEMGDIQTATATLKSVVSNYPDTSAARLAKVRLERIKQEGR